MENKTDVGLNHANREVVQRADACLDLVMEHDRDEAGALGELAAQVRKRRFTAHNREWLEIVEQEDSGQGHRTQAMGGRGRTNYPTPTASEDEESVSPTNGDRGNDLSNSGDRASSWGHNDYAQW